MVNDNVIGDDTYILFRGGLASARLTNQHFIVTQRQGWMLHPDIDRSIAGKKDIKIADLAAGNGIWAADMSDKYPDAEITCLDISAKQFPPLFARAENTAFDIYDMFDPVPMELQGHFDVIHIRLVGAAIYDKDKSALFSNLITMLKPGGFVQWGEPVGPAALSVDASLRVDYSQKSHISRIDAVTGVFSASRWAEALPEHLRRSGFERVAKHDPPIKPSILQYESECITWAITELIDYVKDLSKEGAKEEMLQARQELQRDIDCGTVFAYCWQVVIAQKPADT